MKRIILVIIIFLLISGGFVFYPNKALLYWGRSGHYELTQEMINFYNDFRDPKLTSHQIELILRGAIDEDKLPRPAFHFYDPVYNRGPWGVYTAKKWAINSNAQTPFYLRIAALKNLFTGTFLYHGDYSWEANVSSYLDNNLDDAFYGLGHTLHLIGDMTVPAHTRNDPHLGADSYEEWTGENTRLEDYEIYEDIFRQGYVPKKLYSIEQAFSELARYSNSYFFSEDTILDKDYKSPKIIDYRKEDYGYYLQRTYALGEDENGNLFRLAAISGYKANWYKISPYMEEKDVYFIPGDDDKLNQDYWDRLVPKAIIYGAGVIDLFFKDIAWEEEKLANREPELTFWQKAQAFIKNTFGGDKDEQVEEKINPSLSLPQPKPNLFPRSESIIQEEPEESDLSDSFSESDQVSGSNETVDNIEPDTLDQTDSLDSKEGEQETKGENESRVVKGEKTGDSGGVNPRDMIQEEVFQSPPPPTPPPTVSSLIINEIQVKDNEFVELYNPTGSVINLASYSFTYYSSSRDWNDPYRNKTFPANASISAGGYYLIGLNGYPELSGNPDADWQIYTSSQLSNSAGSIGIFPWDPLTKTVSEAQAGAIDIAAWGNVVNVKEGTSFQTFLGLDKSMQRKGTGQDTDNNDSDFEYKTIPSPTNSNNEERVPGTTIADDTVISSNTIWTIAGSPYYVRSNSNQWPIVNSGVILTIEPGVVIMPQNPYYTFLEIKGTLIAEGTVSDKIVITSKYDTDYGGTGSASAGDWKNMLFANTSANSVFDYVLFRYGGRKEGLMNLDTEMIKVNGSDITIKNSTMKNSKSAGIHLISSNSIIEDLIITDNENGIFIEGGSPTINDCQIDNNSEYGIRMTNSASPIIQDNSFSNNFTAAVYLKSSYPDFSNNSVSNNGLNGVFVTDDTIISQDTTWKADMVYILQSNKGDFATIASGSVLTLESGVIIKPRNNKYTALLVQGDLMAEAASNSEIIFVSLKADAYGGDTNNDGNATSPADNDWKNIKFEASSQNSVLDHVWLYYGTGSPPLDIDVSATVDVKDVDDTP